MKIVVNMMSKIYHLTRRWHRLKKKSKRKQLESKLDKLWSDKVKERANFKCEYCGTKDKRLNSHHIFSRSNKSVRWDLDNGLCLCVSHHSLGNFSAHKNPFEFSDWIREYKGKDWYNLLLIKKNIICKFTINDLEEMIKDFN